MKSRTEHLSMEELILAQKTGSSPAHLNSCAFCSEQLALLQDLELSQDAHDAAAQGPTYRLAAATPQDAPLTLRRTWYLESHTVLLRVLEDEERGLLIGYVITDDAAKQTPQIRFSGLERVFHPDEHGAFEIGPSSIDIEPMDVVLRFE